MNEWSEEDIRGLRELKAAGLTFRQIGNRIGRSCGATKARWYILNESKEERLHRQEMHKLTRRKWKQETRVIARRLSEVVKPEQRPIVPQEVWAERNARLAAAPVDLTGWILGDPPRGFSSLEGRR